MKVALLGGTGFVGRNVATVFDDNRIDYEIASRETGVDIRDSHSTTEFLRRTRPDVIINCAAHVGSLNYVTEQAATVIADNGKMILNMYECIARETPQALVINPIANCAYPATANIFIEDEWWNGHLHRSVLSYGSSKRFLWSVGESFAMQHNIRSIYLLVPNMYGPNDSTDPNKAHALNALISKFVKAERSSQGEITIWGTGVAIREWLYAADFGRILLQIINNPNTVGLAEPLNIGQNFGLSVKELVTIIQQAFRYSGKITWDSAKPDGAPKKVMDDRRFKKVFPDFAFTNFQTGIENTIAYYNSIYPY